MSDTENNLRSAETALMAESDHPQPEEHQQEEGVVQEQEQRRSLPEKVAGGNISFSIWPPSQRTRDAVVNRLIKTLSNPSALSQRYGSISPDEASSLARQIEHDSFSAASTVSDISLSGDDGIEILQAYSKEISKRMLDVVKSRPPASSASTPDRTASSQGASEEVSSVEAES